MSEKLPLLDDNAKMTPYFVDREYAHTHGSLHPTAHVWVLKQHPRRILIQQRAFTKDSYPGQWDMSAAGHVVYQDTIENTALRELEEELNIHTDMEHLISIGSFIHHTIGTFHGRPWNDHELSEVFLCFVPEDFKPKLQPEEVESYTWITPEKLKDMMDAPDDAPNHKKICTLPEDIQLLLQYLERNPK